MKRMNYFGALAVAAIAFAGCNKVEQSIENKVEKSGIPFEFVASGVETKTTSDGYNSTLWATGDEVNLFHAVAGSTTYVSDGAFEATAAGASVTFSGTLASALTADNYDWYAIYPQNNNIETPANTGDEGYVTIGSYATAKQAQNGNDSKLHLAGTRIPVAGKVLGVAKDIKPSIAMQHLVSVICVHLVNGTSSPITVSEISFTGTEDIVGTYFIDFVSSPVVYTPSGAKYVSSTAQLHINNGTKINAGSDATFYMAIKPFTAPAGETISLSVTADNGAQVRQKVLTADAVFEAGSLNSLNFTYDLAPQVVTLPFSIDGKAGKAAYTTIPGLSASGLGSDYASANSPYLTKLDGTGDYIQVRFDAAAGKASIGVKKLGGAADSSFDVMGSADGDDFTKIETLDVTGAANATMTLETSVPIDASYRFIRFVFNKGANVGVGPLAITLPSLDPEIKASNVSDIPAIGGTDLSFTYEILNFSGADDVAVTAFDGEVVASASVNAAGTVTYSIYPNYSETTKNGSITLNSASEGVSKIVSVSQLGETFVASAEEVVIPNNATTATFTITSPTFGWNAVANAESEKNLTISGSASGSGSASAQTITVSSTTVAGATEQTLGTITVYRNGNTSDTQKKSITVKKASSALASTYTKVTSLTAGAQYLLVNTSNNRVATGAVSNNTLQSASVTITGGTTISGNDTIDGYTVTITALTGDDAGYYTLKFGSMYLKYTGSSTNVVLNDTATTNNEKWSIEIDSETGLATIKNKATNTRFIGWNNNNGWKAYSTNNLNNNPRPYLFIKQ